VIDHVSVAVRDLEAAAALYELILAPLGMTKLVRRPRSVGFGKRYPELWLNLREAMAPVAPDTGCHLALRAPDEEAVRAFFAAALAAGCAGDGDPGPRRGEMTLYFGAFVRDPDGNRIEAVTFPKA
jgi:catechol 2,3-dioxygenase-like lactoylglutathione lyase family enzyme